MFKASPFIRHRALPKRQGVLAFLLLCLLALDSLIALMPAYAQSVSELSSQRKTLEQQTRYLRQKKEEKRRAASKIQNIIVRNQMELEATRRTLSGYENHLSYTRSQLVMLANKLDKTLGDSVRLTYQASKRLRSIYMGEQVSLLEMILNSGNLSTLLDRIYYRQKIVEQDKALLGELKRKSQELASQKVQLIAKREEIATVIQKVNVYKNQVSQKIETDRVLRDRYLKDAKYYERAERELLAESEQIRRQLLMLARQRRRSGGGVVQGGTGRFMWPIHGPLTSRFGYRRHPIFRKSIMHTGLDIAGPNRGAVKAADGGRVIYAGWRGGYGKTVMIDHGDFQGRSLVSLYGHLSGIAVSSGESVSKGQTIGYEGSTGYSTGPHLHFEIRENGAPVDPFRHLN